MNQAGSRVVTAFAALAILVTGTPVAAQAGASNTQARAAPSPAELAVSAGGGSWIRERDYRIGSIVYRLGAAGSRFCEEKLPLSGLMFHHLTEYAPNDRAEAARLFGLDRGMGVLSVVAGSPAAAAGVRAGDILIAVEGQPVASPLDLAAAEAAGAAGRSLIHASEAAFEEAMRSGPVQLTLLRAGQQITARLSPVLGCPARGRLARSGQQNAFADGRYAIMTTGFLDFFRNDDELAVAMAHELAHNILRHPDELEEQGVPGGFLRHIGRNARLVRATEEEADRLAIRLLWAAGFDLSAVIPFWRRLYSQVTARLQIVSAHPDFDERERLVREVMAELATAPRP